MAENVHAAPETKTGDTQPPVVVKKYANRRLYNTESSSYITLDNLAEMVRQGRDFVVYDAKTGEDITRGVLTQIIVEQEGKGRALLPTAFLRQLIGFYGDQMQSMVPRFLEQAMGALAQQQEQMRSAMQKTMGSIGTIFPFGNMEEVSRQNMAMMERAFSLFTPFYRGTDAPEPDQAAGTRSGAGDRSPARRSGEPADASSRMRRSKRPRSSRHASTVSPPSHRRPDCAEAVAVLLPSGDLLSAQRLVEATRCGCCPPSPTARRSRGPAPADRVRRRPINAAPDALPLRRLQHVQCADLSREGQRRVALRPAGDEAAMAPFCSASQTAAPLRQRVAPHRRPLPRIERRQHRVGHQPAYASRQART